MRSFQYCGRQHDREASHLKPQAKDCENRSPSKTFGISLKVLPRCINLWRQRLRYLNLRDQKGHVEAIAQT